MKNILLIDTNYAFTGDVESRMILDGIDGVDEIITRNSINTIHEDINRLNPDEVIISGNLINSHPNWDFGIPVKTYARNKEEILLAFEKGLPCYGITGTAKELLEAIRNNRIIKQDKIQPAPANQNTAHMQNDLHQNMQPAQRQQPYVSAQQPYQVENQSVQQNEPVYANELRQFNEPMQSQSAPTKNGMWTCECGAVNTGRFCQMCGKPKPAVNMQNNVAGMPEQKYASQYGYQGQPVYHNPSEMQSPYVPVTDSYPADVNIRHHQQNYEPAYADTIQNPKQSVQNVEKIYRDEQPNYQNFSQEQRESYNTMAPQTDSYNSATNQNDLRSRIYAAKERENMKKQSQYGPSSEYIKDAVNHDLGRTRKPAKVITVYSAKGGVGKTTLSCEIASYLSLTSNGRENFKVCIADFNIDFGDVNNTLNYNKDGACMTLWAADIRSRIRSGERPENIHYTEGEISKFLQFKSYDGQKDSNIGLSALLAPLTNEDSMDIEEDEIKVMLDNLVNYGGFDFVICDTGNNTRDSSFIPLDMADSIIMVLTQSVNTVTCNMGFISTMDKIGFDLNKVKLVINQVQPSKSVGVAVEEIVETIINPQTNKPFEVLAYIKASNDVKSAENRGKPLVFNSSHEFSKNIGEITSKLIDNDFVLQKPKKAGFFRRLFGKKSQ